MFSNKSSVSNLPVIQKGNVNKSQSSIFKKPKPKPNTAQKSLGDMLGINPNILISPKGLHKNFSDYFSFKENKPKFDPTYEPKSIDIDSLEFKETNNTAENIFDSKKTLTDVSTIVKRNNIDPSISEINKSKYKNENVEISLLSDTNETKLGVKGSNQLNQSKVIRNLKKITINLKDEENPNKKDDFKIKLKRIETIKEENEEISKLNITLYKRRNSNPCILDIQSVSDNSETNDFIKIRLINKQNSLKFFDRKFNLSKIVDERLLDSSKTETNNTIKSGLQKNNKSSSSEGVLNIFPEEEEKDEEDEVEIGPDISPIQKRISQPQIRPYDSEQEINFKSEDSRSILENNNFTNIDDLIIVNQGNLHQERQNQLNQLNQLNQVNKGDKVNAETISENSNEDNNLTEEEEAVERLGPKNFIRSTKRVLNPNHLDELDKRLSHVAHSDNILEFRNSLVASGIQKRFKKNNSLDDFKITQSERDFSSSSDSIVTANVENSEVVRKDFVKKDTGKSSKYRKGKCSDFEKRMYKLRQRLKFNSERLFLETEDKLVELKENFKSEKAIHLQINDKYKFKTKIQKRNRLLDYCKINLKYLVKDYLRTEQDRNYFNSDFFVIKRRVVLQETYNEFLKNNYFNIRKDENLSSRIDIINKHEITIFDNFSIENESKNGFTRENQHRRNTLGNFLLTSRPTIYNNRKYLNSYLHKDINILDDEEFVYYSDSESSKSNRKLVTQKQLISLHSEYDSNSSTNYKKTLNFRGSTDGNIIKSLNKQVTKKNLYKVVMSTDFSLLTNPQYFEDRLDRKAKRKKNIRSQNTNVAKEAEVVVI
jgi:hypothetical protein